MDACAINPGDKFFLGRTPPPDLALSLYNVWGVSGAGTVMAAGEGVPPGYVGKKVAVYRSLQKVRISSAPGANTRSFIGWTVSFCRTSWIRRTILDRW